MKALPHVHEPVAEDTCQVCHVAEGKKHNFAMSATGVDMCLACHEVADPRLNVHPPAAEDCLICHDPHGSKRSSLLVVGNQKVLCFGCHDESIMSGAQQHTPAAVGACEACHDPHSSRHKSLLRAAGNKICITCHSGLLNEIEQVTFPHEPARVDCGICHDPHSGAQANMLAGTTAEVCGPCHADHIALATESKVRHRPAEADNGCVDCHSPHGSNSPALLKQHQTALCLGCHDETMASDYPNIQNIKRLLDENPEWHSPIREDGCTGCHSPHGAEHSHLLVKAYPEGLFGPYDPARYEMCFTCHDSRLVLEKSARTFTEFRNGDENLHYLHIHKPEHGQSCRVCHEVHASKHPLHVRDSVPYGKSEAPINFKKTKTGGSCQPAGCHSERTYDNTIGK